MELKRLIGRGVLFHFVNYAVCGVLIPLLLTPLLVSRLGKHEFGIWILLSTIGMYMHLMDLGLMNSVSKFVSEYHASRQWERLQAVVTTYVWLYLALGMLAVGACAAAGPWLHRALEFGGPAERGRRLFVLLAAGYAAGVQVRLFGYLLAGANRTDLASVINLIFGILTALLQTIVLQVGFGVEELLLYGFALSVLYVVTLALAVRQCGIPLTLSPRRARPKELHGQFAYGLQLLGSNAFDTLLRSDRLYVGIAGRNVELVALYGLGSGLPDKLRGIVALMSYPVVPAASALFASKDEVRLRVLIERGSKYHALAGWFVMGFLFAFAEPLMTLWLGRAFPESILVVRVLSVGALATCVACVFAAVAAGVGQPGLQLRATMMGLLFGVGVYVVLALAFRVASYAAVAAAVSGAWLFMSISLTLLFHRRVRPISWGWLVRDLLLRPMVAVVPVGVLGVVSGWLAQSYRLGIQGRLDALGVCAVGGVSSLLLFAGLSLLVRSVERYDLEFLKSLFTLK